MITENSNSAMRHLVEYAVHNGNFVSVFDSVEWSLRRSQDVEKILEEVNGIDDICQLRIHESMESDATKYLGQFAATSSLEGQEDIIDYTCTEWANRWETQFALHIERYELNHGG